ncbi:MAG: hypothetical protein WDZ88_00635 [Candidatus Paceibacterota bacterium]
MIGILVVFIGDFFKEVGASISKDEVFLKKEGIFTAGFINAFMVSAVFLLIALAVPSTFVFSIASLPTLIAHVTLGILQAWLVINAIAYSDRSTYGFLRIWTIPLLLIVDISLGYSVSIGQEIGMILIITSLIFLFINHGLRKEGIIFVIASAINAVITISLYKYNIENFNSVVAEALIVHLAYLLFFFTMAMLVSKENPIKLLTKPVIFIQSLTSGIGFGLIPFAYQFAPASVITAGSRASEIFWSIVSGQVHFHEKKLFIKVVSFVLIVAGLVVLAVSSV